MYWFKQLCSFLLRLFIWPMGELTNDALSPEDDAWRSPRSFDPDADEDPRVQRCLGIPDRQLRKHRWQALRP